jgi:hypothetical protein
MSRQLLNQPAPPARWWPPKPGEREDQAVIVLQGKPDGEGRQDVWVRWHGGELHGRVFGWRIRQIKRANVRRLHAYWLLSMNVHVDTGA